MKSFRLAIGLAAIDGLTCAYVAVLVLALILIGSGDNSPAPDWNKSIVVIVQKSDPRGAQISRMDVKLLVDVAAGDTLAHPDDFTIEATNALKELGSLRPFVDAKNGGKVFWVDCQDDDRPNCESKLFVIRPLSKKRKWLVRLRIADSTNLFSDNIPDHINLKISVPETGSEIRDATLAIGQDFTFCPDWQHGTVSRNCP